MRCVMDDDGEDGGVIILVALCMLLACIAGAILYLEIRS